MKKSALPSLLIVSLCLTLGLNACAPLIIGVQGFLNPTKTYAVFIPPAQTLPSPSNTVTPTATLSPTSTPQPSDTLAPSDVPTATVSPTTPPPTVTPTWILNDPGRVVAPILLYHHVASDGGDSRYYVDTENFRQQMKALRRWGYTSITPSYLAQVLIHGGELPARPVIITFDDGNLDVYTNAFPIMRKMGFVGTVYIVAERLGEYNLVNAEQLAEMAAAGWEVGSHTMSHADLTYNHWQLSYELQQSRTLLEDTLGVPVLTLAYPYGLSDDYIVEWAKEYGYTAGMGLGTFNEHTLDTLFFLNRREVYFEYDINAFSALLPWTEPLTTP